MLKISFNSHYAVVTSGLISPVCSASTAPSTNSKITRDALSLSRLPNNRNLLSLYTPRSDSYTFVRYHQFHAIALHQTAFLQLQHFSSLKEPDDNNVRIRVYQSL